MFLASTAAAMPRGPHISSKKVPKAVVASGTEDPKVLIISWRTEVHDVQPSDRTEYGLKTDFALVFKHFSHSWMGLVLSINT